jgi:hypothetical protein
MKTHLLLTAVVAAAASVVFAAPASGQCTAVVTDLRAPQGSTLTNQGNLLVAEAGLASPLHTGRISIIEPNGTRRTLIDGLPSAPADVGDPSGPAGLAMRGRNLYVAIGVGDVAIRTPGLPPTTAVQNPNGPSSPLFSSVLLIHFSAAAEKTMNGVTLTPTDHQALANGATLTIGSGGSDTITIRMIANFPNFIPQPLLGVAGNIRVSNPFGLLAEGSSLYVTDGGRNLVWEIDLATGAFEPLPVFANLTNTLFPGLGFPTMEPVPTGIASDDGNLLVTLFGGFPFSPGASRVAQVDPVTGSATPFITGLKSPIGILAFRVQGETSYLVLQHASAGPFFGSPGQVVRYDDPAAPPRLVTNCLTRPTSMTLNEKTGTLYVTEFGGRLVRIPFAP